MTCVAAVIENDKIYMVSDLLLTWDYSITKPEGKVFQKDNDYIVGCAGEIRTSQIMQYITKLPPLSDDIQDLKEFIITKVLKVIKKSFRKERVVNQNSNEDDLGGLFLIGIRNKLFIITSDYCVLEFSKYAAIGSGASLALSSLFTSEQLNERYNLNLSPNERLEYAIKSAHKFESTVGERYKFFAL